MTTGEKIKRAREAAGLSQEKLAQQSGVTYSTVTKWEQDKPESIDAYNLRRLARTLGVRMEDLLGDE